MNKHLSLKLLSNIFKADLFIPNISCKNDFLYTRLLRSFKQFIKIIIIRRSLPIFIVCSNKHQILLLNKYFSCNFRNYGIVLVSVKTSLTIKTPGIFIFLGGDNALLNKISKNSSSLIFFFDCVFNSYTSDEDFYKIPVSVLNTKQIIFIAALLKKLRTIK